MSLSFALSQITTVVNRLVLEESSEDETEGVNVAIDVDESDDESSDDEEEEGEDDDDEDLDDDKVMPNNEEPGSDSGCTAVVALLKGNKLYVANAGDSRCIVCRNGNIYSQQNF